MQSTELVFDEFPGRRLLCCVVRECRGTDATRAEVAAGELPVAILDARLVASPFCLHAAAHRALHSVLVLKKPRSASLHAEVVCVLLGNRSVSDAVRVLGSPATGGDVVVVAFEPPEGLLERVVSKLDGAHAPLPLPAYYPGGTDAAAVVAAYHIPPAEVVALSPPGLPGLEAAVLGRIALQDTAT